MNHKLKLKDINNTYGCHRRISERLINAIPRHILLGEDRTAMVYYALQEFNFKPSDISIVGLRIKKQAINVLTRSGIFFSGKIDSDLPQEGSFDLMAHFVTHIIGFSKLPALLLPKLEQNVRLNLSEIEALILRYESNEYVSQYIVTGKRRGSHEAKIKLDFYQRCLEEREEIIKYLNEDLQHRALYKACLSPGWEELSGYWFEYRWTKPFRYMQYRNIEYFDDQKIDLCRHRLMASYTKDVPRLEALYTSGDKTSFYLELGESLAPAAIFERIYQYYMPSLPGISDRGPAFDELRQLLESGLWISFTALALTQVEGIFSNILTIVKPGQNFSSLPTKALAVKPYFHYETRNFDYFEYQLPRLRNSFLHSGSTAGRDFKNLAFDLLYDLNYLLLVFDELNDPQLQLNNFLRNDPLEKITDLSSMLHIFNIITEVRIRFHKQPQNQSLQDVMRLWETFEINELIPSGRLEYFTELIDNTFAQATKSLYGKIRSATQESGPFIDLQRMTLAQINSFTDHIATVLDQKKFMFEEDYMAIYRMKQFVETYKTYLPRFPAMLSTKLELLKKREADSLVKLYLIKKVFHQPGIMPRRIDHVNN